MTTLVHEELARQRSMDGRALAQAAREDAALALLRVGRMVEEARQLAALRRREGRQP
jgi:hypothetical protein